MWLIVGLGNPGAEYAESPHNLGFAVVDRLARAGREHRREHKADAFLWRGRLDGKEVLLAQPQTYMNLSGVAVRTLLRREGLTPGELIVVTDDAALPWSMLRIRERGSDGGHNGLASVIAELGTQEFLRVRLGCQPRQRRGEPGGPVGDLADYVLAPVGEEERGLAGAMIDDAVEAVRTLLREGVHRAMDRFNRRIENSDSGGEKGNTSEPTNL